MSSALTVKLQDRLVSCKVCWKVFPQSQLEVHNMFHGTYEECLTSAAKFGGISKNDTGIMNSDSPYSLYDKH